MPVSLTPDNERKFLLKIIHLVSSKDIDAQEIATCFPGATPRAITEHLYVLRKEAKVGFSVAGCGVSEGKVEKKAEVKVEKEKVGEKGKVGVNDEKENEKGKVKVKGRKGKQGRKRKAGEDVEGEGVAVEGGVVRKKSGKGMLGRDEKEGNGEKGDGEVA